MSDPASNEDIIALVANLKRLGPEQLGALSHDTLYRMRGQAGQDQQGILAPFEHRAFARELTAERPLMALPLAGAIPAYQPYKALKGQARSPMGMDQVIQGYTGVGEGLWKAFADRMRSIQGLPADTGMQTSATALAESLRRYSQAPSTASTNHQLPTRQPVPR